MARKGGGGGVGWEGGIGTANFRCIGFALHEPFL